MSGRRTDLGLHALTRTPVPVSVPLTRIGRYQLITRIALGGMAEVYLARHGELSGFKTLVVVKKVLPHLAQNPDFIAMFLDEARIASLLDHPNVVRIYEVGKASNEYFLAMELVQGKPLSSVLRRISDQKERLDPKLAALVVAQTALGLHHAHQLSDSDGQPLGLVHRDVSPQNVLISFEGSVKVIDFGIARALGRLTDTSSGGMKGKYGYMSPEQARGEEIDHRTDIFALGIVLWESICGKRLFSRETDFATMRAIVYDEVPRPSSLVKIPPPLEAIVMKALARDRTDRFQSAQELAGALERFVFQTGGASNADVAQLMKWYFAEDQVKWKTTTRIALDLEEGQPPVPELQQSRTGMPIVTPSRTGISAPRSVITASGARVVTTPAGVVTASLSPAITAEHPAPSVSTAGGVRLGLPPARRRRAPVMMIVAGAVLAMAGAAYVVLKPVPRPAPAAASAAPPPSSPGIEALSVPAQPTQAPATQPPAAAPEGPSAAPSSDTKPAKRRSRRSNPVPSDTPAETMPTRSPDLDRRPNPF